MHNEPIAANLLAQDFSVDTPYGVWTSNITYLQTDSGWYYLTLILDLFDREVIGYSLSNRLTAESTVVTALENRPAASTTPRGYFPFRSRGTICK